MATRVGKLYRLKNGYSISKGECYDGYNMQYFWCVWKPDGNLYLSCGSYDEAYELASHLKDTRGYAYGEQ